MLISFGAEKMRRAGLTASASIMNRTAHEPVSWIAVSNGRAPRSPSHARHASHNAGRIAAVNATIFSGDQRPERSRRNGMVVQSSAPGGGGPPYREPPDPTDTSQ